MYIDIYTYTFRYTYMYIGDSAIRRICIYECISIYIHIHLYIHIYTGDSVINVKGSDAREDIVIKSIEFQLDKLVALRCRTVSVEISDCPMDRYVCTSICSCT
jgi:hypothetical protein